MVRIIVGALLIPCLLAEGVLAQGSEPFAKIGVTVTHTQLLRSVRNVGMGTAGVADPGAPAALHMNPVNVLGFVGVSSFYQRDDINLFSSDDIGLSYVGVNAARSWRYGMAVRRWWSSPWNIERRTVFQPQGTGTAVDFDESVTALTLAGAMPIGHVLASLGTNVKWVGMELSGEDVSGVAFDVGVQVEWTGHNAAGDALTLRAGACALDLDDGLESGTYLVSIQNQTRVGVGVEVRSGATLRNPLMNRTAAVATVAIDVDYIDRARDDTGVGVGGEVGIADLLYLRAGAADNMPMVSNGGTWGIGLAADFDVVRFRVDVARYDRGGPFLSALVDDGIVYGVAVDYRP